MADWATIQMEITAMPGSGTLRGRAGAVSVITSSGSQLQRMQVGYQVRQLLVVELAVEGGHHGASAEDGRGDAVVVCGRATGQIGLLVEGLEAGAVQCLLVRGVVAAGAGRLIDVVAARLLRGEFGERFGRRQRRSAPGSSGENNGEEGRPGRLESLLQGLAGVAGRQGHCLNDTVASGRENISNKNVRRERCGTSCR